MSNNLGNIYYSCTCGLLKPISQLYFCRFCFQLRCLFCVCHEVDSLFCGKCNENLPSSEAKVKKNRCGNCYVCPSCQQELSTRVARKGSSTAEDKPKTNEKGYYLTCLCCRWTSRDIGIPDLTSVQGGWPERENIHANRLQEILDSSKNVVSSQKQLQEMYKKKQRGAYISFTERTGITAAALRKRIGLPEISMLKNLPKLPEANEPTEEVNDLPEELLTQDINLLEITTIEQRFLQPDVQPNSIEKLFPIHKQLSIKRSLRCKACEHNLSKPEYNPSSVKFKIQLFAYYHLPAIRYITVEPLRAGKPSELILQFSNPTQHQTTICISKLNLQEEGEALPLENPQKEQTVQTPILMELPRKILQKTNCNIAIPEGNFTLLGRDEAAEYDDSGETQTVLDDPECVIRRKANQTFVKLIVTPEENLEIGQEIVGGFEMQHVYTNTVPSALENKPPQTIEHKIKVFLFLGNLVGSA